MEFERFFKIKQTENCETGNNDARSKFLSRLFGIFSEKIVDCWCKNNKSDYENCGRPTIYADGWHYTLDFTFKKDDKLYIVEMKSEIQYQNYKFMILKNNSKVNYLKHHLEKKAFKLFIDHVKKPV